MPVRLYTTYRQVKNLGKGFGQLLFRALQNGYSGCNNARKEDIRLACRLTDRF